MSEQDNSSGESSRNGGESPIDFPPKTAAEFFQRGLKSAQLGIPDKAAADFEEAAWLDPENSEIQFNLGTAYLSMGDFEQAINNFTRAIELRPGVADAHGNRAVAHAAIGEDEKSDLDVTEAVRLGAPPDGLAVVIDYVKAKRK
ncbi:MAG: tetratricopeptide repeat protein [Chloroflexi bacterium]|nr:tetratricopeptide repeat protein [Chloroflexota bacterium]